MNMHYRGLKIRKIVTHQKELITVCFEGHPDFYHDTLRVQAVIGSDSKISMEKIKHACLPLYVYMQTNGLLINALLQLAKTRSLANINGILHPTFMEYEPDIKPLP
jgi:hypothetical protein